MKATEQYFPVVLFIMMYEDVLSFESVDEISKVLTCFLMERFRQISVSRDAL